MVPARIARWLLVLVFSIAMPIAMSRAGAGEAAFLRGNSNGDGAVDISDAVYTLTFLFNAGSSPGCADAADANDDGNVDMSDAISTLGFLYLGQDPPPAPGPGVPGTDPTPDGLACDGATPACVPSGVTEAEATRSSSAGSVTVKATLLNALEHCPKQTIAFELILDTHSVDLLGIDVAASARLEASSGESVMEGFTWTPTSESSHHRAGTLAASALQLSGAEWLWLTIEGVAGSDRVFEWDESLIVHDIP